ncbi:MAG: NAD-glutamate dehydrogenase domain-containing protein [Sphingomonas sp.]
MRWSDRRDDFRTEILGLMKAQRVKNAVIVPTGAKGGFYPKWLPSPATDRDAWLAEAPRATESSSAPCCRSPTTSSRARSSTRRR